MTTHRSDQVPAEHRDVPVLAALDDRQAAEVWAAGRPVHIPSGWSLVVEKEPPDRAYLLLDGRVRVQRHGSEVATLERGDLVGEVGLLRHRLRSATVTALRDLTALVIPHEAFDRLVRDIPAFREQVEALAALRGGHAGSPSGGGDDETAALDTVVLDVDGTLVDTVYQHTIAWSQAFDAAGIDVPAWRLHRSIGMGGDRLVSAVAGDEVERKHGDRLREEHDERFSAVIDDIRPLPGAGELLDALRERGLKVALASSGKGDQTKRLLALFDGERRADTWTSSDDAESSKPAPDLVQVALDRASGARALMVGDAVWDVRAAHEAGVPAVGLRCGGFGEAELRDAGARHVYDDPRDLLEHLDEVLSSGASAQEG